MCLWQECYCLFLLRTEGVLKVTGRQRTREWILGIIYSPKGDILSLLLTLYREVRVQSWEILCFTQGHLSRIDTRMENFLYTYLQVLGLNFLPCSRHDCGLSLHSHRQVSGLRGWFLGQFAAHTQPHRSSFHRWPAGQRFPSPWPSHWHSPERRKRFPWRVREGEVKAKEREFKKLKPKPIRYCSGTSCSIVRVNGGHVPSC